MVTEHLPEVGAASIGGGLGLIGSDLLSDQVQRFAGTGRFVSNAVAKLVIGVAAAYVAMEYGHSDTEFHLGYGVAIGALGSFVVDIVNQVLATGGSGGGGQAQRVQAQRRQAARRAGAPHQAGHSPQVRSRASASSPAFQTERPMTERQHKVSEPEDAPEIQIS